MNGPNHLGTGSYISIGLVVTIVIATWILANTINGAKTEFVGRMDRFEVRLASMEKNKETWNDADMFRWAVHLQRDNPSLKIPEPEQHSGR